MNADDIAQRLSIDLLSLSPKEASEQAKNLLVKAFDLSDWDGFTNLISRIHSNDSTQAATLSRVDFHSRMIHMMNAPRKEKTSSFEHFKQLAREANYDFCALSRNKDGWSIACKGYRYVYKNDHDHDPNSHNLAVIEFMLAQESNPLESESEITLFWNEYAPHDLLIDWVIQQEQTAPKRTRQGGNPIHYFADRIWMGEYGYDEQYALLRDIKIPPKWVNESDYSGLTPLHYVWLNQLNPQPTKSSKPLKQDRVDELLTNLWLKTFALVGIGGDLDAIYPPTQKPLSFHIAERIMLGDGFPDSKSEDVSQASKIKLLEKKLLAQFLKASTGQATGSASTRRL